MARRQCYNRLLPAMQKLTLTAELIAEFTGTLVLMLLGLGVNAMVVLFGKGLPGEVVNGGYSSITFGWGIGVVMGITVAGKITGAHLNPAVTITLAALRNFPWSKVGPYCLAQLAGAFTAAAIVFLNYRPAFARYDPGLEKSAGVFATFPGFPESLMPGFIDQVIGTAILLLLIFAITDERNQPSGNLTPILVGLVVVAIGMSFGGMHGYAINPARDFGPRLFTAVAGFRDNGLTDGSMIFVVPIIGPIAGGLLGGLLYDKLIRPNLPAVS